MPSIYLPSVPALTGDAEIVSQKLSVSCGGAVIVEGDVPLGQSAVDVPVAEGSLLDPVTLAYTNKSAQTGPAWSGAIQLPAPPPPPKPVPPQPEAVTIAVAPAAPAEAAPAEVKVEVPVAVETAPAAEAAK